MLKNENENNIIEPFKVYVRVRPLLERELVSEGESSSNNLNNMNSNNNNNMVSKYANKTAVLVEENKVYVVDPESPEIYGKRERCFIFDDIFKESDNNSIIFDKIVKNLVNKILLGYNSTALAYGVTGTGKTHTMFGDIYLNLDFEKGICMFAVDYLFDRIQKETGKFIKVKINYLEIYNEQVVDLLVDKQNSTNGEQHLMIIEDPHKGTLVPDLTEFAVSNSEQVLNLIVLGNSRRTMAATGVNQFSSRSHAILQINVEQRCFGRDKEELMSSKLLLVDLAGSERGGLEKGIRREEGANINKSLLALGNCINILSDKTKKGSFVPYRDSKLTRLLKDSLGGNISTIMIACISPSLISYDETINTLKYASRARKIQKKITKNILQVDQLNSQNKEIIDYLKNEIIQLKDIIKNQNILLRYKPIDSFRDDRDFINLNLNLNLNINSNPHKQISNSNNNNFNNLPVNYFNNNIQSNSNNEDELLNDPSVMRTNLNLMEFNYNNRKVSQSEIEIASVKKETLGFNLDNYEDYLNKNINDFKDDDFENFEKKLEE